MIVIGCLTEAKRGAPITTTRHYAQIPIINKELLLHQIEKCEAEVKVLIKKGSQLKAFLEEKSIAYIEDVGDAPADALFVPGDILVEKIKGFGRALLTTADGSEEEDALRKLLGEVKEEEVVGIRINYPWEILNANSALIKKIQGSVDPSVIVEDHVTIKGEVIIGKGTVIKSGTYIEGPVVIGKNCTIGPMAHLRPETSIGDNCVIGKTEIYDAVIMKGSVSKHTAYIAHSVLGEDVNVGAFSVTADYRHDGKAHMTLANGEKVATNRRKLGAFIGDHARLGISTSIYPGRKIPANGTTLPGEIITKDTLPKQTKQR